MDNIIKIQGLLNDIYKFKQDLAAELSDIGDIDKIDTPEGKERVCFLTGQIEAYNKVMFYIVYIFNKQGVN